MSEHSGAHEQSKQCRESKQVSGASERANGQASGPVLTSGLIWPTVHSGDGPVKYERRSKGLKGVLTFQFIS